MPPEQEWEIWLDTHISPLTYIKKAPACARAFPFL